MLQPLIHPLSRASRRRLTCLALALACLLGVAEPLISPAHAQAQTTTPADAPPTEAPALPDVGGVAVPPLAVPDPPPAMPDGVTLGIPGCTYTPLTYCIRTIAGGVDGTRTVPLGVPVPVDVDGNVVPDVVVQLLGNPGIPGVANPDGQLSVTRLTADRLPLYLEVSLAVGQAGESVSFGYDTYTTGRSAPATFSAQVKIVPGTSGTPGGVDVSVAMTGSPDQVDLVGSRIALPGKVSGRVRLNPVPANVQLVVTSTPPTGTLTLTPDRTTRMTAWFDAVSKDRVQASVDIDQLPTDGLQVTWDTATKRVAYGPGKTPSSARARSLALELKQYTLTGKLDRHFLARLSSPGVSMKASQDGTNRVTFDSSPAVGQVELGIGIGGAAQMGTIPGDYVNLVGSASAGSVAARITGLSHVVLETGDTLRVEVKHTRAPLTLLSANGSRVALVSIDAMPAEIDLRYSLSAQKLDYVGSHVIGRISADVRDSAGLLNPDIKEARLLLMGLPTNVTVQYSALANGASRVTYDSTNTSTAVELAVATNRNVDLGPATGDYVKLVGGASAGSVAARITGLTHVLLESGDPLRVEVKHSRVPLTISHAKGSQSASQSASVVIDPLPGTVDLRYSPGQQKIEYSGSEVISRITADAWDSAGLVAGKVKEAHLVLTGLPTSVTFHHMATQQRFSYRGSGAITEVSTDVRDSAGIVGRASKVTALVRSLPAALDLAYSSSGSGAAMTVEARDAAGTLVPIGLVEVLLTSGPDNRLPADVDGVRIENLPGSWSTFGRITGLRRASANRTRECASTPLELPGLVHWKCRTDANVAIDSTGGRILRVEVKNQAAESAKLEYVNATLDRLVPNVQVALVDLSGALSFVGLPAPDNPVTYKSDLTYSASSSTNSLTFETNAGRTGMTATLSQPLPRTLQLCTAPVGSYCVDNRNWPASRQANKGSTSYSASEHAFLELYDCIQGDCSTLGDNSTCKATSCSLSRTAANRHGQGARIRMRHFDMASHTMGPYTGEVYLNTKKDGVRHEVAGNMLQVEAGEEKLFAVLSGGFWADERYASWTNLVPGTKYGSINCPWDMALYKSGFNVKLYVC